MKYIKILKLDVKGLYNSFIIFDKILITEIGVFKIYNNNDLILTSSLDGYTLTHDYTHYTDFDKKRNVYFKLVKEVF